MRTEFVAILENGAVIKDRFCFPHKLGKGVLKDVYNGWVRLINSTYSVGIKESRYEVIV